MGLHLKVPSGDVSCFLAVGACKRGPGRGLQPGFQPGETPAPPPADRTPSAPVGPGRRPRAGQVCHPGPACHRRRPKTASRVGTRPRAGRGGPGSGPGRSGGIVGGGGGPGSRPGRSGAKSRRGTTACRAEGRGPRPTARTTPPAERAAPPAAPSRVRTPPPRSPRAVYAVRGRLARDSRASRGTPGPGAASGRGHGAPAGWRAGPEIPVAPGEEHWLLDTSLDEVYWPCSHSRAMRSFPSQLEWKIGLAWANTRGSLNSPS